MSIDQTTFSDTWEATWEHFHDRTSIELDSTLCVLELVCVWFYTTVGFYISLLLVLQIFNMRAFDQDTDLWEPACAPQHQDADLWEPACAPQHMHDSPWSGSPRVSMLCHLSGKACYNSWNMFKDLIQYEMQTQNLQPYIQYFINTSQKFCAKHWDNWVVIGYSVLKYNILSEILIRGTVETKLTDSGPKCPKWMLLDGDLTFNWTQENLYSVFYTLCSQLQK